MSTPDQPPPPPEPPQTPDQPQPSAAPEPSTPAVPPPPAAPESPSAPPVAPEPQAPPAAPGSPATAVPSAPAATPSSGVAAAGAPVGPAQPNVLVRAGIDPRSLALTALQAAGFGYLAAWAASVLITIAVLLTGDTDSSWVLLFTLPPQIVGAGLFGTARLSTDMGGFGDLTLTLWFLPLLVSVAALAGIVVGLRRAARTPAPPSPAPAASAVPGTTPAPAGDATLLHLATGGRVLGRWILSAATAVVLTAGALVLALVLTARVGSDATLSTAGPGLLVAGVLAGTALTAIALTLVPRGSGLRALGVRIPAVLRLPLRVVSVHLGAVAALAGLGGVVYLLIEEPRSLLLLPLAGTVALANLVGIALLGGVSLGGSSAALFSTFGPGSSVGAVHLFGGDLPVWFVVLGLVAALLGLAVASVTLRLGRPALPPGDWSAAWAVPLVYAVAGIALIVTGLVSVSGASGAEAFTGSLTLTVGLAPWFFLVLALWGLAVEAGSRYAADHVLAVLPEGVTRRLAAVAVGRGAARTATPGPWSDAPVGTPAPAVSDVPPPDADGSVPPPPPPGGAVPLSTGQGPTSAAQAPVVSAPGTTTVPRRPIDRRRARRVLLVVVAAVLVVIAATVAYKVVNSRVFGPQVAVEEYLDAVVEGKAERAVELVDLDLPNRDRVLLTDEVYSRATERPTGYTVEEVQTQGDDGLVRVVLRQDGSKIDESLVVHRDGRRFLIFDDWRVEAPALSRLPVVSEVSETVLVNGVEAELGLRSLPVLPGTYTLTLPEAGRWLIPTEAQARAVGSQPAELDGELRYEVSDDLEEEAIRLAEEHLEACLAKAELEPDGCPNATYSSADVTDVVWTLDEAPVFALEPSYAGSQEYRVVTDRAGRATVTGAYAEDTWRGAAGEPFSTTARITFSADVLIDGDDLRLDLDE